MYLYFQLMKLVNFLNKIISNKNLINTQIFIIIKQNQKCIDNFINHKILILIKLQNLIKF